MLWFGLGVGFLVISAISVFFYLNSQVDVEIKEKNAEFNSLLEYAKANKSFEKLVTYAAGTRFKEITFYRLGSSEPITSPKDLGSSTSNELIKSFGVSAQNLEAVKKFIMELKKGKAVFGDPKDNPLMYTRPYLRIEFDGDSIVNIENENKG